MVLPTLYNYDNYVGKNKKFSKNVFFCHPITLLVMVQCIFSGFFELFLSKTYFLLLLQGVTHKPHRQMSGGGVDQASTFKN